MDTISSLYNAAKKSALKTLEEDTKLGKEWDLSPEDYKTEEEINSDELKRKQANVKKKTLLIGLIRGDPKKLKQFRGMSMPPRLNVNPTMRRTLRFKTAAAIPGNQYKCTSVFGALGTIGTVTNTNVVCFCTAYKIRSITVWPGMSTTTENTTSIFWNPLSSPAFGAPDAEFDFSLPSDATVPGAITWIPPKDSVAGHWVDTTQSAANIFVLTLTSQSIIDVDVDFTLANNIVDLTISGIATVLVGGLYYLALDAPGAHNIPPTTLPTTF